MFITKLARLSSYKRWPTCGQAASLLWNPQLYPRIPSLYKEGIIQCLRHLFNLSIIPHGGLASLSGVPMTLEGEWSRLRLFRTGPRLTSLKVQSLVLLPPGYDQQRSFTEETANVATRDHLVLTLAAVSVPNCRRHQMRLPHGATSASTETITGVPFVTDSQRKISAKQVHGRHKLEFHRPSEFPSSTSIS